MTRQSRRSTSRPSKCPEKPFVGMVREIECVEGDRTPNFYGCSFNQFIKWPRKQIAAVVGLNKLIIYECPRDEPILDKKSEWTLATKPSGEDLYTVAWCRHDDKYKLACAGESGRVYVIDYETMNLERILMGCRHAVNDIRTSPINPTLIVVACQDRTAHIMDIRASASLIILGGVLGHRDGVYSVDWTPDGLHVLTSGYDHMIMKWDLTADITKGHLATCNWSLNDRMAIPRRNIYAKDDGKSAPFEIFDLEGYTIFITTPAYRITNVHFDIVDCVRCLPAPSYDTTPLDVVFSKGCGRDANVICWSFGNTSGWKEHVGVNEPKTSHTKYWRRKVSGGEPFFNKFDIDPKRKWMVVGGLKGELQFTYLLDRRGGKEASHKMRIGPNNLMIRQVSFCNGGHILLACGDGGLISRLDRNSSKESMMEDLWRPLP